MLSQLIQRQIVIGSKVIFSLESGHKISGVLIELGRDHVTLERDGCTTVIPIERIAFWEIPEKRPESSEEIVKGLETGDSSGPVQDVVAPTLETIGTEALKKLLDIEARFQAKLNVAKIDEVKEPDFAFPADELKGRQGTEIKNAWTRIREKYNYAVKINELSAKFGRIQPLMRELKILSDRFPNSSGIKRHLAYFCWLLRDHREALNLYKEAALSSKDIWDWYNVATAALVEGQDELACYGLEQFFRCMPITDASEAWYAYIGLLKKLSNYWPLRNILEIKGRALSEEESQILLETSIYLLTTADNDTLARQLTQKWLKGHPQDSLALQALVSLSGQPSESYQALSSQLDVAVRERTAQREVQLQPQGYIYAYKPSRGFGFLRDMDGVNYFFHQSAILDDELLDRVRSLEPGKQIPVVFEVAQGPKGPLAISVTLYRTIEETFARATEYANDGDYSKAIAQIKRVLDLNPENRNAQELYEKWREYARIVGVPRGSNPYARAKRAQLVERDLEKAVQLLHLAIRQGDNVESAIKDLAALFVQQGRPQEAIQTLLSNRRRIQDQRSVDNLLIGFYQRAGQYDQAIALLQVRFEQARTVDKKAQILWQIANCWLRKEDYAQAESSFREVLKLQDNQDNKAAQRNVAFCLFKQGRYEEAQKILEQILNTSPDAQAADLLEAINRAKTGQVSQIDEIVIETTLLDFSRETSKFAQFFLDRCDFQGVPPDRIQRQNFNRVDIQKLEELATQLGTRRPRDRAGYYLSAAKIVSLLEDEDPNLFYKYLCRSFASRGDAIVIENRPLDAAREFYCEALSAYDGDRSRSKDEQDAVNALVRFLFSTLGQAQIPIGLTQLHPMYRVVEPSKPALPDG